MLRQRLIKAVLKTAEHLLRMAEAIFLKVILVGRYHRAGLSNISHHFYPWRGHEMLNETNSNEVRMNLCFGCLRFCIGNGGVSEYSKERLAVGLFWWYCPLIP